MSTITANFATAGMVREQQAPVRRGLIGWMKAVAESYRRSVERRASAAALRSLDDHLLRDIGLDRSEVISMVYGCGTDATRRGRG